MSRPAPRVEAAFDELYAELPAMECQGLCAQSCGPIRMTEPERARIAAAGVTIPDGGIFTPGMCPALTMFRQCSVYEVRPLICRLWGVVKSMPCPWGCRPEGGWLTDQQGYDLIRRANAIAAKAARR